MGLFYGVLYCGKKICPHRYRWIEMQINNIIAATWLQAAPFGVNRLRKPVFRLRAFLTHGSHRTRTRPLDVLERTRGNQTMSVRPGVCVQLVRALSVKTRQVDSRMHALEPYERVLVGPGRPLSASSVSNGPPTPCRRHPTLRRASVGVGHGLLRRLIRAGNCEPPGRAHQRLSS